MIIWKAIVWIVCVYLALLSLGGCADQNKQNFNGPNSKDVVDTTPPLQTENLKIRPQTFYSAGLLHEQQGNTDQAIFKYNQAIAKDAHFIPAYNRLSNIYCKLDRYDLSEQVLKKALAVDPNNPTLHNNLAFTYMHLGKFHNAEAELRNTLAIDPECNYAKMNLGIVFARQQRYDLALDMFTQASSECQGHYTLGRVYQATGQKDLARQHYRTSLKLNPDFDPAKQALTSLDTPTVSTPNPTTAPALSAIAITPLPASDAMANVTTTAPAAAAASPR